MARFHTNKIAAILDTFGITHAQLATALGLDSAERSGEFYVHLLEKYAAEIPSDVLNTIAQLISEGEKPSRKDVA